ncbi:MAG: GNAT family N-acetyltransferase [Candidatus Edwardsbacteria bacterium]|nr:GNAT family N-acetyltransferase [Candidatus Edwardsbacteria bacterium]MBU1576003.1 GNAT family N-acetyltransferase [Candidatus Edwardsbacteria bacterium]MBU2463934.1 GNAT family N-acetyltransferase [Candidatus Edwardsbacteria bacterium]MBU2592926.1 GNAT family N-acetyltransferase [Candidatus Edwardsbacteria bacterium]
MELTKDIILAKGEKVCLRARTLEDIPLLLKWHNMTGQARLFDAPWEQRESEEEYTARLTKSIERETAGKISQAVIIDSNQAPIGTVNSYGDKGNPDHRYVGISIYEDSLISKGMGTEALKLWISFQFETSNIHHIGLETWSFNKRMIRVAEKLGFKNEGCERELRNWNGKWMDKLHYGLLRDEWPMKIDKYWLLVFAAIIIFGCHMLSFFKLASYVIYPLSTILGLYLMTKQLSKKLHEKGADENTTFGAWIAACFIIVISDAILFIDPLFNLINKEILYKSCSYNYLLSSINQSLAALFALVFSLMFILTQLSKDHNASNSQVVKIFTRYVFLYIISFVVAILAPLFLMGTKQILGIKIVLFMAVCNVAMLIPFFWRFKITLTSAK